MRSLFVFVLLSFTLPALAQDGAPGIVPPDLAPPALDDLGETPLPEAGTRKGPRAAIEPEAEEPARLDGLYARLAEATTASQARPLVDQIRQEWMASGSATVDLLMSRAGTALQDKRYAVALDLLDMVIRLAPDYAEGWNRRATVWYLTEEFGRSIVDIERALALEPRHWGAMSGLGIILRRLGRDDEAIDVFHEVLKIHPMSEHARTTLDALAAERAGSPI